jgi:hypothetical protein
MRARGRKKEEESSRRNVHTIGIKKRAGEGRGIMKSKRWENRRSDFLKKERGGSYAGAQRWVSGWLCS